jgi:hypothetical protein
MPILLRKYSMLLKNSLQRTAVALLQGFAHESEIDLWVDKP